MNNIKQLLEIKKPSDIKSLEIVRTFEDDHLPCCDAKINGIEIEFYYYDDGFGFLKYYKESATAFEDLLGAIQNSVNISELD